MCVCVCVCVCARVCVRVCVCVCVQVVATKKYVCSVFYVVSRLLLTKHLHDRYFADIVYYTVNQLDDTIDNPSVFTCSVLFHSRLDLSVGRSMDVLFPFISVLCHSD